MPNSSCNFRYLRTPLGAVKVVNVVFGSASLILVASSYVSIWTLGVFTGTVAACLFLSLLYLLFYLLGSSALIHCKGNRVASFLFHVLAGTALVVAGIELIGWSEYADPSCKHDCPRLYTVGVAKTLTFMNGVLYLIVGFLGVKDDDMLDPESADEDLPLLKSTSPLASIPGSIRSSKSQFYDPYFRSNLKYPQDDIRANYIYRLQRHQSSPADYSFGSYGATPASSYGAVRLIPAEYTIERRSRSRAGSFSGVTSLKNNPYFPYSMPVENPPELHFIKEYIMFHSPPPYLGLQYQYIEG